MLESKDPPSLLFVDDLLRWRASKDASVPLVAFPGTCEDPAGFRALTAGQLDSYVDAVAARFIDQGLEAAVENLPRVIGLLGFTNLSYFVAMHAISRLGYTVFLLSPRLSIDAYASLLQITKCRTIFYSSPQAPVASKLSSTQNVSTIELPSVQQLDFLAAHSQALPRFELNAKSAQQRIAFILHSSGSTGLPKPIFHTHSAIVSGMGVGYGGRVLNTCPLFHFHGLGMMHRTMFKCGTTFYPDFTTPLTSSTIFSLLEKIRPSAVFTVPYTLKLAAEIDQSMEILSDCEVVTFSGSACSDELGNLLTEKGVHLVSICGTSETGPVMTSNRERGDKTWNYLRIIPAVRPYVWMKPITNDTFEFVALDGLKSLVTTNSDNPPKSYHSRDLWTPHPSLPDVWKYTGRLDDRVTLANGEKVLPVPIEGRIRQDPLVREAVVYGVGRDVPGLLLFRSEDARDLPDDEFVQNIWPTVEDANAKAELFAQIGRDMLIPVSADRSYAQTDKGTVIRAKVYLEFADVIDRAYDESAPLGMRSDDISSGAIVEQLEELVYGISGILGINSPAKLEADLFNEGLDSLKAIQLARTIRTRMIRPEKRTLTRMDQNVIYEQGNINNLARYLDRSLHGDATEQIGTSHDTENDVLEKMRWLVSQYSTHSTITANRIDSVPGPVSTINSETTAEEEKPFSVLLTGSTGSLGSHIVVSFLEQERIDRVYCLLRSSSPADPDKSLIRASHGNHITREAISSRVRFLKADITSGPELGLQLKDLAELRKTVRLIIHCGWAVNFNIPLESFAPLLKGTTNLLKFYSTLPLDGINAAREPRFLFISSISVAMGKGHLPGSSLEAVTQHVPEGPIPELSLAQKTGYARSKLCAEQIVANAAAQGFGINASILRVGQVVGDKHDCVWNPNESIPLMLRTARTIGTLPALDENCSWLPVDTVADAVVEIALADQSSEEDVNVEFSVRYYNIVNNVSLFHWTSQLLQALGNAGLEFRIVPPVGWIQMLRESLKASGRDKWADEDPSMKLLEFWEQRYGHKNETKEGSKKLEVRFDTRMAEAHSQTMRSEIPNLIEEGYIRHFLEGWKDVWSESIL